MYANAPINDPTKLPSIYANEIAGNRVCASHPNPIPQEVTKTFLDKFATNSVLVRSPLTTKKNLSLIAKE